VIIPTLDAAHSLARTLDAVADADEIVVVDGGSCDATLALVAAHGATALSATRGRGQQLAAGARAAIHDWLLFLHADTVLAPGWRAKAAEFVGASDGCAAAFRFTLDDSSWRARILECLVALRTRMFALPYGDQALFIHRSLYDEIGGFRPLPLMEDIDIVRRLGRRRLAMIDHAAITSAARWRHHGWLRQTLRNQYCLALYFMGVSPERIRRFYDR
jgi:rSAM/selenodomain-associated transferase 2